MSEERWRPSRRDSSLIEFGTIEKVSREMAIGDACERLNNLEDECTRLRTAIVAAADLAGAGFSDAAEERLRSALQEGVVP